MRALSDVLLATIQLKLARHVHLLELRYGTSGVLRLTDAAADVDADVGAGVVTWAGGADWSEFGSVEETTDRDAQSVRLALSGVDQGITAILLANDFRGRLARIWRAWVAEADNYVSEPDITQWADIGTPIVTGGQADPYGGLNAYLIEDDNVAGQEQKKWTVSAGTLPADGAQLCAIFVKRHTPPPTQSLIQIWDATAAANRALAYITAWPAGGPPVLNVTLGTLIDVVDRGAGWYRVTFESTALTAANDNEFNIYPAASVNADTGQLYAFGPQIARDARALTPYQPADGAVVEAGGVVGSPLMLFPGRQSGDYEWAEERDEEGASHGTVEIMTRVASVLADLQRARQCLSNVVSHNAMLDRAGLATGDTFFANIGGIPSRVHWEDHVDPETAARDEAERRGEYGQT